MEIPSDDVDSICIVSTLCRSLMRLFLKATTVLPENSPALMTTGVLEEVLRLRPVP